jgi:hypothetical protein
MSGVMTADSKGYLATLSFLAGASLPLVGVPVWESSDPTIVVVTPAADGISATLTNANPPREGTATITVTIQSDPNQGLDQLELTSHVTVAPGQSRQGFISISPIA